MGMYGGFVVGTTSYSCRHWSASLINCASSYICSYSVSEKYCMGCVSPTVPAWNNVYLACTEEMIDRGSSIQTTMPLLEFLKLTSNSQQDQISSTIGLEFLATFLPCIV